MHVLEAYVFLCLCVMRVCSQIPLDENTGNSKTLTRVVNTKYGALRGLVITLPNKNLLPVEVYLGVPYASPPMASLRFMPPVTPAHWRNIRPAENFGPVCPQKLPDIRNETDALKRMPAGRLEYLRRLLPYLQNQSEDCLYLNIYAPRSDGKDGTKVPVLVFIHGESYDWNAGNPYDGSVLASFGHVIVVTVNFRLGVLGFLPATEGSARGNYGLMDQVAALHWVQENIAEFGGDPKNVTIFGHGHGAACVNFLVLSPMAKGSTLFPSGLFHRAVMQSGSALSPWAIAHDANTYAQEIARTLGCPTRQTAGLLECMRQRSLADIMRVQITVPDFLTGFGPTVDGIVIQNEPYLMMEELQDEHQYGSFDLMFGVTRVESYFHISAHEERYGIDSERRDRLLRTLVRNIFNYHLQEIFLTIVNEYTDWTRPIQHAVNILDGTLDALGDALVVAPAVRAANYHSTGQHKSYFYVFSYQTEDGDFPQRQGCVHGEDLHYVFGAPLVGSLAHFSRNYSRHEVGLAEAIMTYWVNFARAGDPNSPVQEMEPGADRTKGRFDRIMWPQYESVHQRYLMIGMKPKIRDHYHAHRLSFWLHLFPQLHHSGSVNISPEHHLLDDHDNSLSYDGVVRKVAFTSTDQPSTSSATLAALMPMSTAGTWNNSRRSNILLSTLRPSLPSLHSPTAATNFTDSLAVVMQQSSYSTALSVTIAVGCSLLILNILIFAGIYYQRDKNRAEEKMLKRNAYARANDGQIVASTPQVKQIPLRAPPPSPVCQTIQQQQQELALHPPPPSHLHLHHHPTVNMLPPKVPPKPSVVLPASRDSIAEAQPLLSHIRPAQHPCQQQQQQQLQQQNSTQEMKL